MSVSGTGQTTQHLRGMGKRDKRFVIILDIDRVFSTDELAPVRGAGQGPS